MNYNIVNKDYAENHPDSTFQIIFYKKNNFNESRIGEIFFQVNENVHEEVLKLYAEEISKNRSSFDSYRYGIYRIMQLTK